MLPELPALVSRLSPPVVVENGGRWTVVGPKREVLTTPYRASPVSRSKKWSFEVSTTNSKRAPTLGA